MSPLQKYICLVANDTLKKSDAIVVLEGDGVHRVQEAVRLYKEGWAPTLLLSGGVPRPEYQNSIPAQELIKIALEASVPREAILLEEKSWHTRGQAEEVTNILKAREWKRIMIVASHYHQYRAFLTFLKMLQEEKLDRIVELINAPARQLPWFATNEHERRIDLLEREFERIDEYRAKGHVATYEDALAYLEWKETWV